MIIEHFQTNLLKREKKVGLHFSLGAPASDELIENTESRLRVKFPFQVALFYRNYNGLYIEEPHLKVFELENLHLVDKRIHFAIVGEGHNLYLDTSRINNADQWDIVVDESDYIVTLTFASFWSNKIFAWVDKQRTIWKEEFFADDY